MRDEEFIQLSNLFNSLGIIEKGIEKLYHYLLENKRIDDLKRICSQYNLSLKRGYKIASVLSNLQLIQIYDRPMKIVLSTPLLPIWQRLINMRIEELKDEFHDKRDICITSLEDFIKSYNLESPEDTQEPVELIIFDLLNIEEIYYPFFAKKDCKIAIGIRYENPLISSIQEKAINDLQENLKNRFIEGLKGVKENIKNIDIRAIFNSDLVKLLINSKGFTILSEHVESLDIEFKNIKVRITEENFSNFSLTESELIQPSFDPTNKLMGVYISRTQNIYQIFHEKFNELFEKGVPINEYIKRVDDLSSTTLSETQFLTLCLL